MPKQAAQDKAGGAGHLPIREDRAGYGLVVLEVVEGCLAGVGEVDVVAKGGDLQGEDFAAEFVVVDQEEANWGDGVRHGMEAREKGITAIRFGKILRGD